MKKSTVYLFTSPSCPHCHSAREFMNEYKREDIVFKELSTETPQGQVKAREYEIMTIPTFIIIGPGYPQPIGLRGLQSEADMDKYIDLSQGIKRI